MNISDFAKGEPEVKEILKGMPEGIRSQCLLKKYAPGSVIIRKGESARYVHILVKGEVNVINEFENGHIYIFAHSLPIDFIGELEALAGEAKYAATNESFTECTTIQMTTKQFMEWIEGDHTVLLRLAKLIAKKIYPVSNESGTVIFRSGMFKLCRFIIRNYEAKPKNDDVLHIGVNRQKIAQEMGVSVRTVNRGLKKMKEDRVISIKKGKICVDKSQYIKLIALAEELK